MIAEKSGEYAQSRRTALLGMELAANDSAETDGGWNAMPAIQAIRKKMTMIIQFNRIRVDQIDGSAWNGIGKEAARPRGLRGAMQ